jgi:hypothetical protein
MVEKFGSNCNVGGHGGLDHQGTAYTVVLYDCKSPAF